MKVAYFAHAANLTGANRSLIDLTDALKEKGVVSVVFIPRGGPVEEELKAKKIKYYILPYKKWYHQIKEKTTFKNRIKYFLRDLYNWILAFKAAKIIKKEGIELIHCNSMLTGFGAQVARVSHVPYVWHMREFMEEDHYITFDNERIAISRLRKANVLIAISDVIAKKFSKKLGRKVTIIYNGVDIKKYNIPDKTIFNESRTELLIAGRIIKSKGQMEAVKAVEILKQRNFNVHLLIIGDGINDGELEKIQTYICEHQLEDVIEHIPFQSDLSKYSRRCDIQLVCSHSEAFGRVTVEGMLSHSLVIGADAGCTPYLLKDGGTGLLYTCGDAESLADKIEWAITHKKQAQAIANAGYDHGKEFSIEKTANEVYQLYSKILDEGMIAYSLFNDKFIN